MGFLLFMKELLIVSSLLQQNFLVLVLDLPLLLVLFAADGIIAGTDTVVSDASAPIEHSDETNIDVGDSQIPTFEEVQLQWLALEDRPSMPILIGLYVLHEPNFGDSKDSRNAN